MHVLRRLLKAMTGSRFNVLGSCREAGYRSSYMCVWETSVYGSVRGLLHV